jgi:hypothetical protein
VKPRNSRMRRRKPITLHGTASKLIILGAGEEKHDRHHKGIDH